MSLTHQNVLITGGSRGVGFALAKELSSQGHNVLVTGRNRERLEAATEKIESNVLTFACDHATITDQERLIAFVQEHWGSIDILINNAAIQYNYELAEQPTEKLLTDVAYETQVNFTSVIQLIGLCLPLLSPSGAIVNVTSGLALTPKRSGPVYCATKAALHSFSQSLRWQLAASPQHKDQSVLEALLPMIDTDMTAGRGKGKISPEQAAAAIIKGIERRQSEINVGKVKLLRLLLRIAPSIARNMFRNT